MKAVITQMFQSLNMGSVGASIEILKDEDGLDYIIQEC